MRMLADIARKMYFFLVLQLHYQAIPYSIIKKHMVRLDISVFPPFLERMDRYHGNILVKNSLTSNDSKFSKDCSTHQYGVE